MGISDLIGQFSPDGLGLDGVNASIGIELPPELTAKISNLIGIGKVLAIVIIIYFILLIIKQIVAMRDSHNLKIIARNTTEINAKISAKKK